MADPFGEHEAQGAFESLRSSIQKSIEDIADSRNQDFKAIQNRIREQLTELRASSRLLEEFAEEQDR